MGAPTPDAPDLVGVITAANEVGLPYVVIGGFAVIANQYVRGTEDVDLLISGDHALDDRLSQFLASTRVVPESPCPPTRSRSQRRCA